MLTKIRDKYRKIEEYFLIILMLVSTLIVCYSVFMRYVLNAPPVWSEEIVCYLQVWIAFIGISYVARNQDDFIRFDFIIHNLDEKTRSVIALFERIVLLFFMGLLAVTSFQWLIKTYNYGSVSTPMKIPNWIPRLVIPVSFLLIAVHYAEALSDTIREIRNMYHKEET